MDSRYCAMWPIAESNRTILAEINVSIGKPAEPYERAETEHRLLGELYM